jgi:chromate transporter
VSQSRAGDVVPLREAFTAWFQVSLQTFGGPAGQISVMHTEIVERRRWVGEQRFLHALSYCTLLPGPEAQQLAIYLGWLLNGTPGGLLAGTLFVLPGFVAILGLSIVYAGWGDTTLVTALFAGVAPAVIAIVAQAVVRLSRRALYRPALVALAVAAFVALAVFGVPFPLVVGGAAVIGYVTGRYRPTWIERPASTLASPGGVEADDDTSPLIADDALHEESGSWRRAAWVLAIGLTLWIVPTLAVIAVFGPDSVFAEMGLFFSGAALVTFGGAYAVLTYVAQRAVEFYGWISAGNMIAGLALAETTPGPLIMVVQFVGFLGAYQHPGDLNPWVAGVLASLLVTWVTFVPCFLFIFLGAPHVEGLRANTALSAALTGITASVVGVIANLAVFFAVNVLFDEVDRVTSGPLSVQVPVVGSFDPLAAAVAALAFLLLFRLRWSVLRTLGVCAAVGALLHLGTL